MYPNPSVNIAWPPRPAPTKLTEGAPLLLEERGYKGGTPRLGPPLGSASIMSSIFNLSNTIVGAGVITLPYALRVSGAVVGGLLTLIACIASAFSFSLLIHMSDITGKFSYRELSVVAYGPRAVKLCELVIMLYTAGTCIGRGVLIGDFIPKVFEHWLSTHSLLTNRTFIIAAVAILFMLPLSLPERLEALRYTSLLALLCVMYTLGVLADNLYDIGVASGSVKLVRAEPSLFLALPLLVVAYTAHYNCLSFYAELADRSSARMHKVTNGSCVVALLVYFAYAYIGYLQFGGESKPDVLNNFSATWIPVLIARLTLGLALILSYPLVLFALRKNLQSFLFSPTPTARGVESPPPRPTPRWVSALLTIIIVVVTNAIAIVMPNIGVVFGFSGSIFGVAIVYVLPAAFYIRIYNQRGIDNTPYYVGAWLLAVLGGLGGLMSVMVNIVNLTPAKSKFQ